MTTGFTDERVRAWLAATPRRWPRWALTGLWVVAFVVSTESDDEPCTTADLTVCGPDLGFSLAMTFCFAAVVLVWWRPVVAAACAVAFAVADVVLDYLWQAKVSWTLVAVAFVLYAVHLRSCAARQRRVAREASVPLLTRPRGNAQPPPLDRWHLVMAAASVVLGCVAVGSVFGYARAVGLDDEHRMRSQVVDVVALTEEDDEGYQRVRVESPVEQIPPELEVYLIDVPLVGEGVSVRVDPKDLSWTHGVAEPPDRTWWMTAALGALLLAVLLAERLVSTRARQRWLGREAFATGVPVRAVSQQGQLRLRSLDSNVALARFDCESSFEEERTAPWIVGPTLPDVCLVGDVRDGGWTALARGPQVFLPQGAMRAAVELQTERVAGVEVGSLREVVAVIGYALGMVLGCGLVWFGITEVGPAWATAQGRGVPGQLVVTEESCGKSCDYYGTFTSDDGRFVFRDVSIVGAGEKVGDVVPALYQGSGEVPDAVYTPGWDGMIEAGFFVVMGGGFVLGSAAFLIEPLMLRRPGRGRHERFG